LAFIDIFLPEDASFDLSNETARRVESIAQEVTAAEHRPLESLTTFVGGGGPRFWYSLSPEPQHPNYAQVVLLFENKHDTHLALPRIQDRVSREIAGARIDVRQLETGDAVGLPVAVRISGEDIGTLRSIAANAKQIFAEIPLAARVRDNWGEDRFNLELAIDTDRANLAGVTNLDVAASSATAINGYSVTTLREGDKQIPVVARLRVNERARLDEISNLYVYSSMGNQKVPLRQVSTMDYSFRNEVIRRRNQFRTITVSAAPRGPDGFATAGISTRNRRRGRKAGGRIRRTDGRARDLGGRDFLRPHLPVQKRDQAIHRLRGRAVWRGRSSARVVDHGRAVRFHGLPRRGQPGRCDREPHHRAV
jgi:multidrug efflux pump subunit AcrB